MKKIIGLFCVLLFIIACSDDKEIDPEKLTIDKSEVTLNQEGIAKINILTGNGDYNVVSVNENVAIVSITDEVITITAKSKEFEANTIVVVKDKYQQTAIINVNVTNDVNVIVDLYLSTNNLKLNVDELGEESQEVEIVSGNSGYVFEYLKDEDKDIFKFDISNVEETKKFRVLGLSNGKGAMRITDKTGMSSILYVSVKKTEDLVVESTEFNLSTLFEVQDIIIKTGNGGYEASVANPLVAKVYVEGKKVKVEGRMNGETTIILKDSKGKESNPIKVKVDAPEYALDLQTDYFCYTDFSSIAGLDPSIKECKQVTFEMTCKVYNWAWLQTFLGLESNLIIRGLNDPDKSPHVFAVVGLKDKIMMESTTEIPLNEWFNLAFVVDCDKVAVDEKYKMYINGKLETIKFTKTEETHSSIDLTSSNDGGRFVIGRATSANRRALNGAVSFARVWTVARTEQQIKDNMCSMTENSPLGLFAFWNFSEGIDTNRINDISNSEFETSLTIAEAKDGNYNQSTIAKSRFITKGCPN